MGAAALLASAIALLWAGSQPALAAPSLPLDEQRQERYRLDGERLVDFLDRFLSDQGVAATFSPALRNDDRRLSGIRGGSPEEIFRSIVRTNRLAFYYDGRTLNLYKRDEIDSEYVAVSPDRMRSMERALRNLSGAQDANTYTRVEEGLIRVRGVTAYIDEVRRLARALGRGQRRNELVFRFFNLQYAWADDRRFHAGDREVIVPGIASTLRQLVGGPGGAAATSVGGSPRSGSRQSLRGSGLARNDRDTGGDTAARLAAVAAENGNDGSAEGRRIVPMGRGSDGPTIVAAPYGNGVIVRDDAERMPLYAELIDALDVEPTVIEIQATIINVNIDELERLGVEFRAADDDVEGLFGEAGSKADFLGALGADDVAALGQVPGFQLGAIIRSDEPVVARISALAQEGAADIVSRPTILTMNGFEAVVESSERIFLPVEGAFEVDLFDVFAGTVLRVTPNVVEADRGRKIRLFITVDDGEVQQDTAEGDPAARRVPKVSRNSVTTQALIRNGQSLLLGGLIEERTSTEERKVPLLGDIPLLGALFRSRQETNDRIERLFLIRPRVVDPDRLAFRSRDSLPEASREALDRFEDAPAGRRANGSARSGSGTAAGASADPGREREPRPEAPAETTREKDEFDPVRDMPR